MFKLKDLFDCFLRNAMRRKQSNKSCSLNIQ